MLKSLSDFIHRVSTGWVALLALVVFSLFIVLVLPNQAARAEANTGGANSPDGSFFYTTEELYKMAEAYGEEGRQAYIRARFTFDLIWPMAYTLFLGTWISWVFRKAFTSDSLWQRANLAPVLGGLLDYLENISASVVMARYPNTTAVVDMLATIFTMTKWVFVSGSFVLLIVGVIIGAVRWIRAKGRQ
jgi:hypothetical protein